jgi:hypothetical protein
MRSNGWTSPLLLTLMLGLSGCSYALIHQRYSSPSAAGAVLLPFNDTVTTFSSDHAELPADMRAPVAAIVPAGDRTVMIVPCDFTEHTTQFLLVPPIPFPFGRTTPTPGRLIVALGLEAPRTQWRIDVGSIWLERGGERIPVERWGRQADGPAPSITASGRIFHACRDARQPPHAVGESPIDFPASVDDYYSGLEAASLRPDRAEAIARAKKAASPFDPWKFDETLWLQFAIDSDPEVPAISHRGGLGFGANVPSVELRPASRRFSDVFAP